jgi:hypothetical protein
VLTPDGKWLQELPATALPPGTFDEAWFALTPQGRIVHTTWEPGQSDEDSEAGEHPAT